MDFQKGIDAKQRGIEMIILLIFSVYDINMIMKLVHSGWSYSSGVLLLLLLIATWILFVRQYHTFEHRSLITTVIIECSILLYAFQIQDFYSTLPTIYVFATIVTFYGFSQYVYFTTVVALIFMGSRMVESYVNPQYIVSMGTIFRQTLNLVGFEIVLFVWTKGRMDSERKVKMQMESLNRQLEEQFALIGIVGQAIQNPVRTIQDATTDIEMKNQTSDVKTQLQLINGTCDYINGRAVDITDYAKIQSERLQIEEQEYDVIEFARLIATNAMVVHAITGVEFVMNFDGEMPRYLIGDREKINRVILQLIGNAYQFTKDGYVSISIGGRKESYGYNLVITIRDTGIGMNEEEMEQLLSNKKNILAPKTHPNQGIGIGLYVAKMLIEKMGGTLMVQAKKNKGTQLQVVLPQKMNDSISCMTFSKNKKINCLIYINTEQFRMVEVRDAYMDAMTKVVGQLPMGYQICRNLSELKRRAEGENYTHVIISDSAYHEDEEYFNTLSITTKLVLLMDRDEEIKINNERVYYVYKPFFLIDVIDVLWENVEINNYKDKIDSKEKVIKEDAQEVVINRIEDEEKETEASLNKSELSKMDEEPKEKNVTKQDGIVIGDLDVKTAVLYCGGESSFLTILTQFILKADETREELVRLYENQDWNNYVIKVHGLKSSMLSLGAKQLSDQAKELEYAGKAEKYDLIHNKMGALLAEYDRVIAMASAYPDIAKQIAVDRQNTVNAKQQQKENKSVRKSAKQDISKQQFDSYIEQLENYSYELAQDEMLQVLDEICQYQYRGEDLENLLTKVRKQIMESDLFSASENVQKVKEKLEQKEGM